MVVAAECAGLDAALAVGCSIPSSRLGVSVEWFGGCAGMVINSATRASTSVVAVPVIKRLALGVVGIVVIKYGMVVPIESPMRPAPSIASEEADSEAGSER
jgi:hypothetical protein